jgi:hypothetical protein
MDALCRRGDRRDLADGRSVANPAGGGGAVAGWTGGISRDGRHPARRVADSVPGRRRSACRGHRAGSVVLFLTLAGASRLRRVGASGACAGRCEHAAPGRCEVSDARRCDRGAGLVRPACGRCKLPDAVGANTLTPGRCDETDAVGGSRLTGDGGCKQTSAVGAGVVG